jgi:hypothetical protein
MKVASSAFLLFAAGMVPLDLCHAAGKDQSMEQVIVNGTRVKPYELRQRIMEVEDRFYSRYNELNDEEEFDVNCIVAAPTGTNLKHRSCRPVFEERAIQEHGREVFLIRQDVQDQLSNGVVKRAPGTPSFMPMDRIIIKRPAFRKHMRQVVEQDRGLRDLLELRAALEQLLGEVTTSGGLDDRGIEGHPTSVVPADGHDPDQVSDEDAKR